MTQPRTADGRYAEKPGVGLARRMSERLREALGHDGQITPPEKTPLPSIEELLVRVDALNATVLVEPDLTDVDTLTGAAMVLGTDTIADTAEAVLAMGKAAPLPLIYDARQALETKDENWDAKLHPRDGNGRFINVGAVLNLLGSVGGGRGTVIGNGPNNTVTIRREDGTTLDVPGDQTYADGEGAPTFGQAGVPDTFSKTPGSFAKTPAAAAKPSATGDTPDAKTPPADRISPPNLPNDRNELFRALNTNQATRGRPDKMALHFAANAIGATGDGRESGTVLASHSNDQATNDRIGEMLGPLSKIADELDADGVTVTTDGGAKLSDYLRDYADGFHQIHQARIDVTAEVNAEPDQVGGLLDALAGGGFTWREDSGYRSDGFAVAVPGHGQSFPPGEVDRAKLIDYARSKASELRANPALHLGGWVEDDGTSWLDLSEVYDTKDEAYQAGQGRGEIAIADIAAFAKGEDGTVPISYAERPPSGPAADKWDDPNSGVLKDGGKASVPDTAAGGGDGRGVREPGSGRDAGTGASGDTGAAGPGRADGVAERPAAGGDQPEIGGGRTYTDDEVQQALVHYKGITYARMNNWLRDGELAPIPESDLGMWELDPEGNVLGWKPLTQEEIQGTIEQDIGALRQLTTEQRTTEPVTVFRGAQGDWTNDLSVGSVLTDAGFTSASGNEDHAQEFAVGDATDDPGVLIEIDMPVGTHAIYWGDHVEENWDDTSTLEDEEQEWIIAPGSSFEIVEDLGVDEVFGSRHLRAKLTAPVTNPDAAGPEASGAAPADVVEALRGISTAGRPDGTGTEDDPIDVGSDINRAVELLAEGKHIRLSQPDEVATLLDRLAELTKEAKAKGDKAPVWDLCRVSVPGTNLFCAEHQGIKRIDMPQLEGSPIAGTPAADMEANQFGNVNLMEAFVDALDQMGVSTTDKTMPASHLRASQRELDGSKVAGITKDMKEGGKPWLEAPIFVTRDGYVIDGHHRWAAKVGIDVEGGKLGDVPMDVRQIDLDVGAALDYANAFTARMGIASQGVDTRPGEAGATNAGEVRSQEDLAIHESIVRVGIVQQRYLDAGKDTESLYDKIHGKKDKYTAEREAQHESVIAHFVDAPTVKKDEKAVIIGGLPGAGKTTFINSADGQARLGINLDEYVTVNPDDVKEEMAAQGLVPNYEGLSPNEQATLYHEEASAIAATIMERAMEQGKNVLYDTSMKGEHQTDRMVNAAKASGHDYSTTAVFIDVPIDTAKERALSRYQNGGRFVPLGIIDRLAAPPDSGYNSVNAIAFDRSKSKVDQWVHVDNSSFVDGPKIVGDSRDAAKDAAQTAMDKYGVDLATANEIVSLREQMRRPGTDDILWQALEDRLVNLLPRKAA